MAYWTQKLCYVLLSAEKSFIFSTFSGLCAEDEKEKTIVLTVKGRGALRRPELREEQ